MLEVLTGYAGCMTVLTGNAVAELISTWLLPLVEFLELQWVLEQPVSSLFFLGRSWFPFSRAQSAQGRWLI